jgi:hypothetical protein
MISNAKTWSFCFTICFERGLSFSIHDQYTIQFPMLFVLRPIRKILIEIWLFPWWFETPSEKWWSSSDGLRYDHSISYLDIPGKVSLV